MATTGQHAAIGVVSATKGEVFAKGADGQMRRLAVGDQVFEGDVIVTANGSTAEITPFNGPVLHVQEQQTVAIDAQVAAPAHEHDATAGAIAPLGSSEAATVIQNVAPQAGQDFNATLTDDATAAGLTGGDGAQGGHNFVDLMRIIEAVPTVGYDFPVNPTGTTPIIVGQSATPTTNTPEAPPSGDLLHPMADSHLQLEGTQQTYVAPLGTSDTGSPAHFVAGSYTGSLGSTVYISESGSFSYAAPVGDDSTPRSEIFSFKTVDDVGSQSTSTVTINIQDTAPLANNDYGAVVSTDTDYVAHGSVMQNDVSNVDMPVLVTSVNGIDVAASGTTAIHGTYGTLTIDATGQYDYVVGDGAVVFGQDGSPLSDNVAMYGVAGLNNPYWMQSGFDISSLLNTLSDGDGVAAVFGQQAGFGVLGGASSYVNMGESLIFSLDHAATSVNVSLGGGNLTPDDAYMVHWYAYGEDGSLIGDGDFTDNLSLVIDEPTAIKTLVIHNTEAPSFDVTGVSAVDAFSYTVTDHDGSTSTAQLFVSAGHGLNLTADNGGLVVVGSDNSVADSTQVAQWEPFLNDFLYNPEHLSGGAGNDVLSGGPGDDVLTGGGGVDTFVWHLADAPSSAVAPWDVVTDFRAGDVLELNDLITSTSDVTVKVVPASGSDPAYTQVVVSSGGHEQQAIFLLGYEATNSTDMAAQLKATTHFTG